MNEIVYVSREEVNEIASKIVEDRIAQYELEMKNISDKLMKSAINETNDIARGYIRTSHSEKIAYHKWIKDNLSIAGVPSHELKDNIELVKKTFFLYLGYDTNKWCEVELKVIIDNIDSLSEAVQHVCKLVKRNRQISIEDIV